MGSKYNFNAVMEAIAKIVRVWTENKDFSLGEITLEDLQAKITAVRQKRDQIEDLRSQLVALSNDLNDQLAELAKIKTRALSGLRASYGPDSTQYEQGGGTRSSERKRSPKKGKPE